MVPPETYPMEWPGGVRLPSFLNLRGESARRTIRASVRALLLTIGLCAIDPAQSQHIQPIHISSAEAESHLVLRSSPSAPPEAQAARISGTVILEVAISPSGEIDSVRIVSGHPILARRAVETVRGWKYKPFVKNGVPVDVTTEVAVEFKPARPQPVWYMKFLFAGPYALLILAWLQRYRHRNHEPRWRGKLSFIGLLVLSASLAVLSAELTYSFVIGHKLAIIPSVVAANGLLCLLAGVFCLFGKGPGRWFSFVAAALLIFIWGIHLTV